MEIRRYYEKILLEQLRPNKVLVLLGARRVGKTSLIQKVIQGISEKFLLLNGDDIETHMMLETRSASNYQRLLGDCRLLIIDEAQEIPEIGKKLKLMVDSISGLKVLISGSSAFEINNQLGEPLVGRMKTLYLYPIAQLEFSQNENTVETYKNIEERLVFGSYPELLHLKNISEKTDYLKEVVNNQLLRDILAFEGIKKREKMIGLLQKIAFRIGSEVSLEALGKELNISKNTVEKYLDLYSKVFIVYGVSGFSRNRDNEITKMKKWYFYDNGIRNAVINSFAMLNIRTDTGQLWENYLNCERIKKLAYSNIHVSDYFWRTHNKQEIDRIEEKDGKITAYEYKWGAGQKKVPSEFASAYPDAEYSIVNRQNYLDYIL